MQFTDDIIFGGKTAIFQIVVLLKSLEESNAAWQDLKRLGKGSNLLSPRESSFFIPRTSYKPGNSDDFIKSPRPVYRTATGDEFAQSTLCESRPTPRGYDEMLIWKSVAWKRYVIVRPDRFVFAVCNTTDELERAAARLKELFES